MDYEYADDDNEEFLAPPVEDSDSGDDSSPEANGNSSNDEEGTSAKKVKTGKEKSDKYMRPATTTEIQTLRNTSDLFQSNLMKFRIEELLERVKLDRKSILNNDAKKGKSSSAAALAELEDSVRLVRGFIESVGAKKDDTDSKSSKKSKKNKNKSHDNDDVESVTSVASTQGEKTFVESEMSLGLRDVCVPLLSELRMASTEADNLFKESKSTFTYAPPSNIFLVGSYLLGTMMKTQNPEAMEVDLAVEMPASIFQEKDYRDYRYFQKRALYLAHIAAGIRDEVKNLGFDIEYEMFKNNARTPVIRLVRDEYEENDSQKKKSHKDDDKEKRLAKKFFSKYNISIRIIPMLPKGVFQESKLSDTRCNIRKVAASSQTDAEGEELPTPIYSQTILNDTKYVDDLNSLHAAIQESPAISDAIILGSAWLTRHSFRHFNKFMFTKLLYSLMFESKKSSSSTGSSKQSAFIKIGKGFSSLQMFKVCLQVLATEDKDIVEFRRKARELRGQENDNDSDVEDQEDLTKGAFAEEDAMFRKLAVLGAQPSPVVVAFLGQLPPGERDILRAESRRALRNLSLRDGFDAVFVRKETCPYDIVADITMDINLQKKDARPIRGEFVTRREELEHLAPTLLMRALGQNTMMHRPEHARIHLCNIVSGDDTTPKVRINSKEFADSTDDLRLCLDINQDRLHAEVLQGPPVEEKELCDEFKQIWGKKAELRRFKSGDIVQCVEGTTSELVSYLMHTHFGVSVSWPQEDILSSKVPGSSPYLTQTRSRSILRLLRGLDLPLAINSVIEVGEAFRDTQLCPTETADVMIELESSTRWPTNNVEALIYTKMALLCNVAETFKKEAKTNLESSLPGAIDVDTQVCTDGFVEISVHYLKPKAHLIIRAFIVAPDVDTKIANVLSIKELERRRYASWFGGVVHRQTKLTPVLAPLIRLTKRWLSAHMIVAYFPVESIEAICLHIMKQKPWASIHQAFRRVIEFFANPYPIDIIVDMDSETRRTPVHPSEQTLWISTDMDEYSRIVPAPSPVAMSRVVSLSQRLIQTLTDDMEFDGDDSLFRTRIGSQVNESLIMEQKFFEPILDYDIILKLDPKSVSFNMDEKFRKAKFANLQRALDERTEMVDMVDAPQRFIEDLSQLVYTTLGGLVFYDRCGGTMVGIVMDPTVAISGKNRRSKIVRLARKLHRLFYEGPMDQVTSLEYSQSTDGKLTSDDLVASALHMSGATNAMGLIQPSILARKISQQLSGTSSFVIPSCSTPSTAEVEESESESENKKSKKRKRDNNKEDTEDKVDLSGFPTTENQWNEQIVERIASVGRGLVQGIVVQRIRLPSGTIEVNN